MKGIKIKNIPTIIIPILNTVGVLNRIDIKIPSSKKERPIKITNRAAGSMISDILYADKKTEV